MKNYSDWEPTLDYKNESPFLEDKNRPWLRHWPTHIPKSIKFEPIPVHEYIKRTIIQFPNNICIHYKPQDKKYSYRELIYNAEKIANSLYSLGVRKGDGVGIMTSNCPEFLFCCL
ncbi:MAG: AMP-binding protein, partial [Promethearchaeota archaeon]